jgi:chemotaxis protein methyltransferase CheR
MHFSTIEKMICQRTGLTFDAHRTMVLRDKITHHMAALGVDDMTCYYNDIRTTQALFDALVDQLTINESYFFREPAYLDLLCHRMLPELAGKNKKEGLSILSAGCSTGEEPCSIAMAVEQAHGPAFLSNIRILGVDIDHTALSMARTGMYGKWKLRQLSPLLLSQYFKIIPNGQYAIRPDILKKIAYYPVNLVEGPLPAEIQTVDIIFYRNVSIYFDKATRMKVFSHLERVLTPGGYLVVGAAEILSHDTGALCLVDMDGCFVYQKKSDKSHTRGIPGEARAISSLSPKATGAIKGRFHLYVPNGYASGKESSAKIRCKDYFPGPRLHGAVMDMDKQKDRFPPQKASGISLDNPRIIYDKSLVLARQKKFDSALDLLKPILEISDSIMEKVSILRAGLFMQKGDIERAKVLCRQLIDMNVICSPAYLLLGMIASMEHQPMESLNKFRETTYIQPDNWLAHFLMFQAYQTLERQKEASRQATVVVRLLEKDSNLHHGLDYFPFSFSREQILLLCRQHAFLTT